MAQIRSHNLIDDLQHQKIYERLKLRHGDRLVSSWTERTDPLKFVYEDIGITSYLISLWTALRFSNESTDFVDLGCGNGLLVHLLASEGYNGRGVDVRSRKIWSQFAQNTLLEERPINCPEALYDCEWLIGNHSDELTPWIILISAKSKSNFFLLPCCAFEFSGKFNMKRANRSVYQCYFDWLISLAEYLGFTVLQDRLKIPSTKRRAIIGLWNTSITPERIDDFTRHHYLHSAPKFSPRAAIEEVKNCTQIDRNISADITMKVFRHLLQSENNIQLPNRFPLAFWNAGGSVSLKSISDLLSQSEKSILRSQHGGLQTLLKNHPQIFLGFEKCANQKRIRLLEVSSHGPKMSDNRKGNYYKTENQILLVPQTSSQLLSATS